jgi:hypothetical protein
MLNANPNYLVTIMSVLDSPGQQHISVTAPMPETFMYDASVQYDSPFTQALTGNVMIDTILRVGVAAKLVTQAMTAQIWQGSTETELGLELEFQAETNPATEVRDPIVSLLRLVTASTDFEGLITSPGPKIDSAIMQDFVSAAKKVGSSIADSFSSFSLPGTKELGSILNTGITSIQPSGQGAANAQPSSSQTLGTVDYYKSKVRDQISIRIGNYAFFDSVVITSVQKTYESQFDALTGLPYYAKVAIRFKPLFMITQSDLNKIFFPPPSSGAPTSGSTLPLNGTNISTTAALGSLSGLSPAAGQTGDPRNFLSNAIDTVSSTAKSIASRVGQEISAGFPLKF